MRPSAILASTFVWFLGIGLARSAHDAVDSSKKYFHEPGVSAVGAHYDVRFFSGELSYEDHRSVLRRLIKAYLVTCREKSIQTWLAHGTLLGWWWNGKILPWDHDIDVQMTTSTLTWVGENFNRTEHDYKWTDAAGNAKTSTYLLDVNPHHNAKRRGDGQNLIDARWIDVANGAFIDITGLRERDLPREPGVWSCRDFHRYHTTDLFPMRQSEFEGTPATVPHNFERILTDEYGSKCLAMKHWAGHHWDSDKLEWAEGPE